MRAVALTVLCGCRSILGIDDVSVIDLPDRDAPIPNDASPEAGPDVFPFGCPATYMALPNSGPRGHRYYLLPGMGTWQNMRDSCLAASGFLAFPDGNTVANAQLELTAVITLSGNGTWIGVSDLAAEDTFRNSLDMLASTATSALIQGGNTVQNDCANAQNNQLNIEGCGNMHKAVCECVP